MMGHNGTIAFGLTLFFGPDEEDLYVYETSPDDPDLYRYKDGWERMTRLEETVKVKGASDQSLRLKFTRHGPIIHEDRANRRAYAVRSVWFGPGAAPYMVSISRVNDPSRRNSSRAPQADLHPEPRLRSTTAIRPSVMHSARSIMSASRRFRRAGVRK
jgi:hypothetical protein